MKKHIYVVISLLLLSACTDEINKNNLKQKEAVNKEIVKTDNVQTTKVKDTPDSSEKKDNRNIKNGTVLIESEIRQMPNMDSPVIKLVKENEELKCNMDYKNYKFSIQEVLDNGWWYLIELENDQQGWIFAKNFIPKKIDFENVKQYNPYQIPSHDKKYALLKNFYPFADFSNGFAGLSYIWLITEDLSFRKLLLDKELVYHGNSGQNCFVWTNDSKWIISQQSSKLYSYDSKEGVKKLLIDGFSPAVINENTIIFYEQDDTSYTISKIDATGKNYKTLYSWTGGFPIPAGDGITNGPVNIKDNTIIAVIRDNTKTEEQSYYGTKIILDLEGNILKEETKSY